MRKNKEGGKRREGRKRERERKRIVMLGEGEHRAWEANMDAEKQDEEKEMLYSKSVFGAASEAG